MLNKLLVLIRPLISLKKIKSRKVRKSIYSYINRFVFKYVKRFFRKNYNFTNSRGKPTRALLFKLGKERRKNLMAKSLPVIDTGSMRLNDGYTSIFNSYREYPIYKSSEEESLRPLPLNISSVGSLASLSEFTSIIKVTKESKSYRFRKFKKTKPNKLTKSNKLVKFSKLSKSSNLAKPNKPNKSNKSNKSNRFNKSNKFRKFKRFNRFNRFNRLNKSSRFARLAKLNKLNQPIKYTNFAKSRRNQEGRLLKIQYTKLRVLKRAGKLGLKVSPRLGSPQISTKKISTNLRNIKTLTLRIAKKKNNLEISQAKGVIKPSNRKFKKKTKLLPNNRLLSLSKGDTKHTISTAIELFNANRVKKAKKVR